VDSVDLRQQRCSWPGHAHSPYARTRRKSRSLRPEVADTEVCVFNGHYLAGGGTFIASTSPYKPVNGGSFSSSSHQFQSPLANRGKTAYPSVFILYGLTLDNLWTRWTCPGGESLGQAGQGTGEAAGSSAKLGTRSISDLAYRCYIFAAHHLMISSGCSE